MQLTNSIAFIWYDYTYSPLGFLTEAKFSSSYAALGFSCSYTYDRQGNILTSRQESQPYNTILFTMGYTYEGNQLLSIDRVLPGALPYEPLSVSDFTERGKFEPVEEVPLAKRNLYDANGNLVYDRGRGLTIDYNLIERPERIVTQSGDTVYYVYTATGEKLSEIYRSRDGLSDLRRDFAGVHEMTDGWFTQLNLQQGYIDSIGTLHIYVPDFQGNVIGVVNSRTHQLEQQTDYYPYGQPHPDALGAEIQRRKYGGKELLTELGLDEYDFSARRLAPCGSFTQPDPKATKYPWLSPYAYCAGDPINYVDPTGMFFDNPEKFYNLKKSLLDVAKSTEDRINTLENKLKSETAKGSSESKLGKIRANIDEQNEIAAALNKTLATIQVMEEDPDRVYKLERTYNDDHHVRQDKNGKIIIEYSDVSLAGHEITHVQQYLDDPKHINFTNGRLAYQFYDKARSPGIAVQMEVEAYKVQYAIKKRTMPIPVRSINDINYEYISSAFAKRWLSIFNRCL